MINISPSAAQQIQRLQTDDGKAASFLRVKVVPGGCSGMSYKLDFDQALGDKDKVFEEHGTKVVVDSKSLLYIAGMTLDYEGGLNGKGFHLFESERGENLRLRLIIRSVKTCSQRLHLGAGLVLLPPA